MPQVHSTTPINREVTALSSEKPKSEGIDALFASILAQEQSGETAGTEADVDVSNQSIDDVNQLITETTEQEHTASPDELLQQIVDSVNFKAELNNVPEPQINLSGESLPLDEQTAEVKLDSTESDLLIEDVELEQSIIGEAENSLKPTSTEKSHISTTNLTDGLVAQIQSTKSAQGVQQSAARSTQNDSLKSQLASIQSEVKSAVVSPQTLNSPALATEAERAESKTVKTSSSVEPLPQKKDNKTISVTPKNMEIQTALKAEIDRSEITPTDEVQDLAEGLNLPEKTAPKTSLQFGQTAPNFVNNERVESREVIPRFNVSLKQGLEQQVQMQDVIQRFAPVMKQQVMAMVNNGIGQAEIRLDPPELGHMMVRIQVQQDQTQVQFQVANPTARDLLEQATPRLRDMLMEQGLNLSDSQISYHDGGRGQQEQSQGDGHNQSAGQDYGDETVGINEVVLTNITADQSTGIDYYA